MTYDPTTWTLGRGRTTVDAEGIRVSLSGYCGGQSNSAMDFGAQKRLRTARLISAAPDLLKLVQGCAYDDPEVAEFAAALVAFVKGEEKC